MNISVLGHAGSRAMLFTLDGMYREINMPLGAQLLCSILSKFQFVAAPDLKPEEALRDVWNDEPSENLRREYMVMRPLDSGGFDLGRSLGFREGRSAHSVFREPPARPQEPTELIIWDEGLGGLEIPDSGFRAALWASPCAIPDPAQFEKVADKCFLFLSADALRDAGAMISRRISWERACSELIWQLQENPAFAHLAKAARIMVAFAEDGAVYIKNSDKGQPEASLILAHGGGEGTLRERSGRRHDDAFPLMAGALGAFFTRLLDGGAPPDKLREILEIGEGFLLSQGYAPSGNEIDISINASGRGWPAFPIPIVARQSATACANALAVPCGWAAENGLPGDWAVANAVPDDWAVANNVSDGRLLETAFNYVLKGAKSIDGLPQLSLGALITIDRWEIEAYQNIRNLIVSYAASESARPLSIAVFGAPGSGKSFGVAQIAENVLPGKTKKLEFNVSQFSGPGDLGAAFQMTRDAILERKLPLVFFDEFDCDRDGSALGWLKLFLMPMQDGRFKDETGAHPLGRCILVFAGGTAASIEEFARSMKPDEERNFRDAKGPDFLSRLKGTIGVLGPNRKGPGDRNYILRRALLLRGMLERRLSMKDGIAPASPDVINAMLLVPEYRHGARSMEAILDMSQLEGGVLEPSVLPFRSQLALHLDADAFRALVWDYQRNRGA